MQLELPVDNKELFKQTYRRFCKKYDLPRDSEDAVWMHLVVTNCCFPEKFVEGIKTFGFKIEGE
jgi:hypothetical protein